MKRSVERALKWAFPVLILAEVILVRGGVLHMQTAVGVVFGVEGLLLLFGGSQILRAIRRYRRDRTADLDARAALTDGLSALLPRRAARLAVLEMQLWASLARWLFRRRRPRPQEFTYHQQSLFGVFLIAALFSSPIEILLFELLIPWAWLRWVLLIASLYALIWVLGHYASLVVHPHRLEAEGIRLCYGAMADGFIPYTGIAEAAREQQKAPKKSRGLFVDPGASTAHLGMDGAANIVLRLASPQPLRGFLKMTAPVVTIYLAIDDPERFVREVRQRAPRARVDSTANALERTEVL